MGRSLDASTLPMAKTFMQVACRKQSLVCLAADRYTMAELFELLEDVGPSIAALKTHVDLIGDWNMVEWKRFCARAQALDLLIFEDRKFAESGKFHGSKWVYLQHKEWSDLVTAHLISGPDIVDGLQAAWAEASREGGVFCSHKCPAGNLLNQIHFYGCRQDESISVFGLLETDRILILYVVRSKIGKVR